MLYVYSTTHACILYYDVLIHFYCDVTLITVIISIYTSLKTVSKARQGNFIYNALFIREADSKVLRIET